MALPPTIPTSFIPHTSTAPMRQFRGNIVGAFSVFAYGALVVGIVLAVGVFLYDRVLASNKAAKDAALASAQSSIDRATVENFVRLRNRLNSSGVLLDRHPALSSFFSTIETILPSSVRFVSLHISLTNAGAKIDSSGIARNFNALAAASNAFASDGRIKDAIFSNISVNKDSSVSFALSAKLDQKLIAFTPSVAAGSAPVTVP